MKRVTAIILSLCMVVTFAGTDVFAVGTMTSASPDKAAAADDANAADPLDADANADPAAPGTDSAADADAAADQDADANAGPDADADGTGTPDTDTDLYAEPQAPTDVNGMPGEESDLTDENAIENDLSDFTLESQDSKLSKPKKLRANAGYKCVMLDWKPVKGADGYIITRTVAGKGKFSTMGMTKKSSYTTKVSKIYTDYAYRVYAYKKVDGKTIKSAPAKIRQNAIRRLRIYVTFKINKKYSNGDKISAGTTVMSDSFGGGNYLFRYKGRTHSIARISVRNISGKYKSYGDYSGYEAEMFASKYVRSKKVPAKKKYLIWVSTYTQHLYVLKKVGKNKWNNIGDWEISTGAIGTPTTTTGDYKKIYKKKPSNDGISYWNYFSPGNALHGCNAGMIPYFGSPASHGCVRNPTEKAHWIYKNCAIGTPVIMY